MRSRVRLALEKPAVALEWLGAASVFLGLVLEMAALDARALSSALRSMEVEESALGFAEVRSQARDETQTTTEVKMERAREMQQKPPVAAPQ